MQQENIKQLRVQLKLTQAEFAKIIGVSAPTVSNWEKDKSSPKGNNKILLEELWRARKVLSIVDNQLVVGWSLLLDGLTSIPAGFNPTVGGSLYLNGLTSIPAGFNPTVGGSLYLNGLTSIPAGFNPTVGWSLYLNGLTSEFKKLEVAYNEEKQYIYCDDILIHIKKHVTLNGYDIYYGKIKGLNVVSDGANYAHCDKIKDGIADLLYKSTKDRGAEQYANLDINAFYTIDELQVMYRVITGACAQGTQQFIDSIKDIKPAYTIVEAIELCRGRYKSDVFSEFFTEKN